MDIADGLAPIVNRPNLIPAWIKNHMLWGNCMSIQKSFLIRYIFYGRKRTFATSYMALVSV